MFPLRIIRHPLPSSTGPCVSFSPCHPLQVGDRISDRFAKIALSRCTTPSQIQSFSPSKELSQKTALLFSCPGAFTPRCSEQLKLLAGKVGAFKRKGAEVFLVSTETCFAMKAWQKSIPSAHKIHFIPDSKRELLTHSDLAVEPIPTGDSEDVHPTSTYLGTVWPRAVFTIMEGIIRDAQIENDFNDLKKTHPDQVLKRLTLYQEKIKKHETAIHTHQLLYPPYVKLMFRIYGFNNTTLSCAYTLEELDELPKKVEELEKEIGLLKGKEIQLMREGSSYKKLYLDRQAQERQKILEREHGSVPAAHLKTLEYELKSTSEFIQYQLEHNPGLEREVWSLGTRAGVLSLPIGV